MHRVPRRSLGTSADVPINDIGELSYAVRHGHVRDVEPHPNASSYDARKVGTSIVEPQQLGDGIDTWSIRQHSCDATCKGPHPNELLYVTQHPDGLSCAGQGRSDSHVGLHRSESWYAEHNRYVWMCEAHSIGPVRNSPSPSSPNQPTLCTKYFEALLYSLKQTCERRALPLRLVPCSDRLPTQSPCRNGTLVACVRNVRAFRIILPSREVTCLSDVIDLNSIGSIRRHHRLGPL